MRTARPLLKCAQPSAAKLIRNKGVARPAALALGPTPNLVEAVDRQPVAVATGLITLLDDFNDAVRTRIDENRSAVDHGVAIIANSVFRRNVIVGYAIARQVCAHSHIAVVRI